jgi:hypothetical protein
MKRVVFITMSAILLFSFSVFAQKIQPRPVPKPQLMTVQDDVSGSFLVFEMTSGEYKFIRCKDGAVLTGYGLVKETAEGDYTFEHIQPDRRLTFWCNMTTHEGKGYVETFSRVTLRYDTEPINEPLYDSYMDDSVADCVKK